MNKINVNVISIVIVRSPDHHFCTTLYLYFTPGIGVYFCCCHYFQEPRTIPDLIVAGAGVVCHIPLSYLHELSLKC